MQKHFFSIRALFVVLLTLLSACKSEQPGITPTGDPAVLKTAAAQTASAYMTATALVVPSQTPTLSPTTAAPTLAPSQTPTPTASPAITATSAATMASSLGERAEFVADVTIPDGTDFKPADVFTKTWRLKNAGSTTWTPGYALVFISGERMGGPDRVSLLANVPPGATVDISVNLAAPANPGTYRGFWKLLNTAGKFIDYAVYVEIDVISQTAPTATVTTTALSISNVTMSVDPASFTGQCPKAFTFTGKFSLNQPATVAYQIEAGAENPSFTFSLPAPQTANFGAGEQVITFVLDFSGSVNGWARLRITSPIDISSGQANFMLTCQP